MLIIIAKFIGCNFVPETVLSFPSIIFLWLSLLYKWENWGSERFNLTKVTQLVGGRSGLAKSVSKRELSICFMPGIVLLSARDSRLTSNFKVRTEPCFRDCQELTEESQWRNRKRLVGETFVDTEEYTV